MELRSPRMRGANVTVPHKEAILPLLDEVAAEAAQIGAVNTVVSNDGRLCGYNTDITGFVAALHTVLPAGAHGLTCLVLGAGGAARAVVAALVGQKAGQVLVANRTVERAGALCASACAWGSTPCSAVALQEAQALLTEADLIVNATSLGLPDSVKDFPIDVDTLHSGQVLMDLAYGAAPTLLVAAARARNVLAADGREMLIQQAAGSYRLWTGQEPPVNVMRGSIDSLKE
jgi:shikimate dehydrogenase